MLRELCCCKCHVARVGGRDDAQLKSNYQELPTHTPHFGLNQCFPLRWVTCRGSHVLVKEVQFIPCSSIWSIMEILPKTHNKQRQELHWKGQVGNCKQALSFDKGATTAFTCSDLRAGGAWCRSGDIFRGIPSWGRGRNQETQYPLRNI